MISSKSLKIRKKSAFSAAVPCSVPGCDFVTPASCPQRHASVHGVWGAQGQAGAQVCPKPAPVSRPGIDLGATKHNWRFFKAEFDRYKLTTGIKDLTILDELWHCKTKALRTLMQAESAIETLDTEAKLLDKMIRISSRISCHWLLWGPLTSWRWREDLITYVAAEESGYKDSVNIVQSASTIGGGRSTYQKERDIKNKCYELRGPETWSWYTRGLS